MAPVFLYTKGGCFSPHLTQPFAAPPARNGDGAHSEAGEVGLLTELLALTKMNWNSTELINLEPITLSAARSVGRILRHIPAQRSAPSRFSFFM